MTGSVDNKNEMKTARDTTAPPEPRRRWFRYSLRGLLIVVTLCAIAAGYVGKRLHDIQRERATVAWIEKQKGFVKYHKPRDGSLDKWLGTSVSQASLSGRKVSHLSPLAELKNLELLSFNNTQVRDLSPLAELTNLKWLYLNDTGVSDLGPLANLTHLRELDLDNTQVHDLTPLTRLNKLSWFSVENTLVSPEQVQMLQKALPRCSIVYSPASDSNDSQK